MRILEVVLRLPSRVMSRVALPEDKVLLDGPSSALPLSMVDNFFNEVLLMAVS